MVNDPAFPHAKFKCTLCSCYFNDEYANRLHVKGRRHRLNFKKMYDPSLRIEPTKQQKKQSEARRRSVEQRKQPQLETGPVGGGEEGGGGRRRRRRSRRRRRGAQCYEGRRWRKGAGPESHSGGAAEAGSRGAGQEKCRTSAREEGA